MVGVVTVSVADRQAMRENALSIFVDRDGEVWIEAHEVSDAASPDLMAARDVLSLLDALAAAEAERDRMTVSYQAVNASYGDERKRAERAEAERDRLREELREIEHWPFAVVVSTDHSDVLAIKDFARAALEGEAT